MVEVNKVEVGFTSDVSSFNRGVDKMERKLETFDKTATKSTEKVGKRFDFLDGELKKVEKTMGGFGDDLDLTNVQTQLEEAKQEFTETGKVGERTLDKLNKSVNRVDFSTMPTNAHKAFTMVQKDISKLSVETDKLNRVKFAEGYTNENKLIAHSFANLDKAMNDTMLSFDNASKHMNSEQLQKYVQTTNNARHSLFNMKKELESTGTVSSATFYKVNENMKKVNFNQLNLDAQKAVKNVSKQFGNLTTTFDTMGTSITKNQNRIKTFSKTTGKSARYLKNSFGDALVTFNRWGTVFRNMQEVGEHVFGGVLRPLILGLVPVAGTATTAVMGIGAGLGAVAGGAVGLGGAFGIAGLAVKAFSGQATTALQMLEDGQLKVTNEVQRYQSTLKGLQNDWKSLINQNQAHIFNTMSNGIDMARYSLSTLNPFLVKTAAQIEQASAKMHKWLTSSKNAANAFAMLNKIGPPIFQNILNSAGHVGNGITRIFTAFGPLFTWTGQGLEKLSKKFDIWANSTNTQRGIASFINYTKANLPILGSIFGNTFLGIIELFKAFSGQTTWALKGLDGLTKKFRNWAATLDETQGFKDFIKFTRDNAPLAGQFIGNLVDVIVQLVKAMAPISVIVLKVVSGFLGWLGAMMKTNPWLGKLIGSLLIFSGLLKSGLFIAAMINSFTRLDKAIKLLIGTQKLQVFWQKIFNKEQIKSKGLLSVMGGWYTGLIAKIKAFSLAQMLAAVRTKALGLALKIQAAAIAVWTGITKGAALANKLFALSFRGIGTAIKSVPLIGWALAVIGILITLWQTNATFRRIVINAWNAIKQAAINVFGWLKPYLQSIWNGIKTGALWTWNALKIAAVATWNAIKFAIMNPIQALKMILSGIWNGIKFAAVWAWNAIKTGVMFVINAWLAQVRANFNTLKSFFSSIWNGIKTAAIWTWNAIKNGVMFVISGWVFAIRTAFSGLKTFFTAIWNGIKSAAIWAWNGIKNGVMFIVRGWLNQVKANFNTLKSFFSNVWNGIKNISISTWNAIKNGVLWAIRGLSSGTRSIIGTLRNWIVTAWNYIKNKVVALARSIWSGVRTAFNNLSMATRKIIGGLRTWLIKAWTYIKNKVVGFARAIWTGVRTAFNNLSFAVRKVISTLRTWLVKAWTYIRNKVVALARSLWTNVRKAFTSLWASTRKIFTTLKNWVVKTWTYIKNKVIALARSLWTNVRKAFTYLWNSTKKIFTTLRNWLVKTWTYIRNKVVSLARSLWNGVKKIFNALWNFTRNLFNKLKNWLINTWKTIRNKVVKWAQSLWSGVKRTWNSLWSGTRSVFTKVKNWLINTWKGIKNSVVNTVKKLWSSVRGTFNAMNNGLKNIIGKIKGHITSMINKVKSGLNKLIDGVNWVGKKLGMGKIGHVKMHTGTSSSSSNVVSNGKLNTDTFATVGDKGRGNGTGGFRHETVIPPKGKPFITPNRDTLLPATKGTKILNGKTTQAMMENSPKFAKGTIKDAFGAGANKIADFGKGSVEKAHDMGKATMKTGAEIGKKGVKKGAQAVKATKAVAGEGADWLKDKVGDVMDYVKNPGKLVNKILKGFGVNFDGLGKKNIPADMMAGMFKKLKASATNLIKGWLEDAEGGEGDAGWLLKHDIWQKFGNYTGGLGFNGGKHYGVDFGMTPGTNVKAVAGGKVSKVWNDYGGGKSMEIDIGGGLTNWYMHLNKQLKKKGDKVGVGDLIAKSGNTGNFTAGSGHLHFQLNKGGKPQSNVLSWLKGLGGSGSKSANKWKGDIRKAAKATGTKLSGGKLNDIVKLIATESNGNPKAIQGGYTDINTGGNEARGLLQYTPGTWGGYKTKKGGNIMNGYHQLKAFFNNSNWSRDLAAWKARMARGATGWGPSGSNRGYADGGIPNAPQLAWLAEGGFSESIVSHDPANKVKSKAIHDRTGEMLGFNDDVEVMRIMADLLRENNAYQADIAGYTEQAANKSSVIQMNGKKVAQEVASDVNKEIKKQEQRNMRMKGKV